MTAILKRLLKNTNRTEVILVKISGSKEYLKHICLMVSLAEGLNYKFVEH